MVKLDNFVDMMTGHFNNKEQFDGENKNHSCPLSYSFCIFWGSLSGNMAFIASSLPSFIAVS